jgi:NAD(P)-dependent dehydrogenase (short-subunit alcohol dehydrogenase family)
MSDFAPDFATTFLGYKNKRVIVTGCFSGMGEATARLLIDAGAEVHGLDYKDCTLPLASFRNVDLRHPASIDDAVASIGGKIHGLFNCAGLPQTFGPMEVMKVNYLGTRYITQKVIGLMPEGSAIATISSTAGMGWSRRIPVHMEMLAITDYDASLAWLEAHPDHVREGYSFSKEAINVWTMKESFHLIHRGIRINCTLPGPTQTPMMSAFESATDISIIDAAMQPINRRSTPREQATALVFLNSDAASYINGVVLAVDGGFMSGLATGQVDASALMGKAAAK